MCFRSTRLHFHVIYSSGSISSRAQKGVSVLYSKQSGVWLSDVVASVTFHQCLFQSAVCKQIWSSNWIRSEMKRLSTGLTLLILIAYLFSIVSSSPYTVIVYPTTVCYYFIGEHGEMSSRRWRAIISWVSVGS